MNRLDFIADDFISIPKIQTQTPAENTSTISSKPTYTSKELYLMEIIKEISIEFLKCKKKTVLFSWLCVRDLIALGYLEHKGGYITCFNRDTSKVTKIDFVSDQDATKKYSLSGNKIDIFEVRKLIEGNVRMRMPNHNLKKYAKEFLDCVPETVLDVIKDLGVLKM